ncbi:hypothetical protein O181_092031 [Austropuccinia psidii MF-1]|uniref:Uncharacterized protein n=1 Tax=Austropuccinia psidii MF-1 TaxID=1389203 RepID=A0A9Q3IYP7_9BASI|nr:hypothetical protein [Austropuccinia psidii MF-1]
MKGEESVEAEGSDETEVESSLKNAPEALEAANPALYKTHHLSEVEPSLLKMMEQMTQLMGKITQAVSLKDNSRVSEFKTPSIKAPDSFDCTKATKLGGFIHSFQLIFHN